MKHPITLFALAWMLSSVAVYSQSEKIKVYFGISPAIGIFTNVEDVNTVIENYISSQNAQMEFGTSDMILNLGIGAHVGLRIIHDFEFQGVVEASYGLKSIIIDNSESKNFVFSRYSPGLIFNYHIPVVESGKHSLFVGTGILFHFLEYEGYSCFTPGFRGQAGFSINNFKFNPQVFLGFDYAKGSDDYQWTEYDPWSVSNITNNEKFELNFSSVRIGVNLNF